MSFKWKSSKFNFGVDKTRRAVGYLEFVARDGTYKNALEVIEGGIRESALTLEDIMSDEDRIQEILGPRELERLEDLLGVGFVFCQTRANAVICAAQAVRATALKEYGDDTFKAFNKDHELRQLGPTLKHAPHLPKVKVLWELANYFKHRDQWTKQTWERPSGIEKYTVEVISKIGLSRRNSANLRRGAEALDMPCYASLAPIVDAIDAWAEEVIEVCRAEVDKFPTRR